LNRTGSVPVSYFNSPERSVSIGAKYENRAYGYFATLNNPDLARVVQYTALYQLFMDNHITYSGNMYSAFPKNKPYLLQGPTKTLLNVFKGLKENEVDYFTDSLTRKIFNELHREKVLEQMADNERVYNFKYTDEDKSRIFSDIKKDNGQRLKGEIYGVKNMLNGLSDEQFSKLCRYLSYPRGTRINNKEDYNMMLRARSVNQLMREIGKNNLAILGLDLGDVKNFYVNSLSRSSARYLKTPSVIVTFNDFYTTGGHNLSSRISRVNSMTNYKHSRNVGRDEFDQPAATNQPTLVNNNPAPSASKPSTTSSPKSTYSPSPHSSSTPKSSTGTKPSSSPQKSTPAAKPVQSGKTFASAHNTRPRSSVIPTQSRPQRGL
ncbi:MAG: hypothetical protein MJZ76_09795, partial [Bacteroidales bacterium]|nr:hypothetical protein [Bacteroidales bacterium]